LFRDTSRGGVCDHLIRKGWVQARGTKQQRRGKSQVTEWNLSAGKTGSKRKGQTSGKRVAGLMIGGGKKPREGGQLPVHSQRKKNTAATKGHLRVEGTTVA